MKIIKNRLEICQSDRLLGNIIGIPVLLCPYHKGPFPAIGFRRIHFADFDIQIVIKADGTQTAVFVLNGADGTGVNKGQGLLLWQGLC